MDARQKPYHHGDLRLAILDAAEGRLTTGGIEAVTIRACARDAGVSPAAPLHHFGSLKGLLSALAARGFTRLVARLDADLAAPGVLAVPVLVGAYVAFAVSAPRLFDLMWRDDLLLPDDAELAQARRLALGRLQAHAHGSSANGDARRSAIRTWSLSHGLATLLLHGRIVKTLGDPATDLATVEDFIALAYNPAFASA